MSDSKISFSELLEKGSLNITPEEHPDDREARNHRANVALYFRLGRDGLILVAMLVFVTYCVVRLVQGDPSPEARAFLERAGLTVVGALVGLLLPRPGG